jgi:hypothetical protein
MKPIYECLDYLLGHLFYNRFKPEGQRIEFDVDHVVMPELNLTTHEEFKGLMDMLIDDKNAYFLDGQSTGNWTKVSLDEYRKRTVISPQGIDLLRKSGYYGMVRRRNQENSRLESLESHQKNHRRWMTWLTVVLTVGTLAQALYALTKLYWENNWFQSQFWWSISIVVILLSGSTTYLVLKLLQQKKKQKGL